MPALDRLAARVRLLSASFPPQMNDVQLRDEDRAQDVRGVCSGG